MSPITTHVLDTALGRPAAGVPLILSKAGGGGWASVGRGVTDADGRCKDLMKEGKLKKGAYRLTFGVAKLNQFLGETGLRALPFRATLLD